MTIFPFDEQISLDAQLKVHYELVIKQLSQMLTKERQEKIFSVVQGRCFGILPVLEGIYDRGNISAVMRSAEAMGFVNFHVVETQERFKEANRVTQGADKWVEMRKWKKTQACVEYLKSERVQICVTSLESSVSIEEVDFSKPTALVLGNEKEGVSPQMLEAADLRVRIPMVGFVQSYNISVAGALCFYHIFQWRKRHFGRSGDLSAEQMRILAAHYFLRTQSSGEDVLKRLYGGQFST